MRTIIFYRTEFGRCPVKEFLDSLNARQAQKVVWVLLVVEELERVPKQYFKKLVSTDDIWEVRVRTGGEFFRLLGFFYGARLIVLNHAFSKKTRKTPAGAIVLAENRKRDYLRRKKR